MKLSHFSIKVVLLVCACGMVLHMTTSFAIAQAVVSRKDGRFCGRDLVNMLAFLCEGVGYFSHHKRYDPEADELSDNIPSLDNLPLLSRKSSMSVLVKRASFLRKTRGVIDECCYKPCNYRVLTSYCAEIPNFLTTTQRTDRPARNY